MTKDKQDRRMNRLNRLMEAIMAGRKKGKLYRLLSYYQSLMSH